MPPPLAPHKSSLHRIATLSLYRALLRSSAQLGGSICPTSAKTLRSLIQYRFLKDKGILSRTKAANGIQAGYGFLEVLRACSAGQAGAVEKLSRTLETVTQQAEKTATYRREIASRWKPPPPARHAHLRNLRLVASPRFQDPTPNPSTSHATSSSPLPPRIITHPTPLSSISSSVRKVPNLILAHGIPLLKYPGPTPVILNRVLKEKILWGVRKWEQFKDIEGLVRIAEWEDEWDGIVARHGGVEVEDGVDEEREEQKGLDFRSESGRRIYYYDPLNGAGQGRGSMVSKPRISWATHLREEGRAVQVAVMERGKKYAELGDRYFHEVIVKERELKERERKEGKHARRMARKQAAGIFNADGKIAEELDPSSVASGFI